MKANIETDGRLTLIPESDDDKRVLKIFTISVMSRPHSISCDGFIYLEPSVDFIVGPIHRG